MATGLILKDAYVRLSTTTCFDAALGSTNSFDISGFTQSVEIVTEAETRDNTTFGAEFRSEVRALRRATITLRSLQQFSIVSEPVPMQNSTAAGTRSIDSLLWDVSQTEAPVIIAVRPDNAIRSSCNPDYWMPASLNTHNPLDGAWADLLITPLRFTSQGAGLTRYATSS